MTVAVGTNVIIAAVLGWHEHHEAARVRLASALRSGVVLPTRVLVESYAVLTRLPPPHRLAPQAALAVLEGTLRPRATVAALPEDRYWDLVAGWATEGVAGGSSYDAEITAVAAHAGAQRILTFNDRHFARVVPAGMTVEKPAV